MKQEYKPHEDSKAIQIAAFVQHYKDTKARVSKLTMFSNKAAKEGGVLTLSREALEDDIAIAVSPSFLMPRLLDELEAQKVLAEKLERKARLIIDILNS
jgi:hypothetical protein